MFGTLTVLTTPAFASPEVETLDAPKFEQTLGADFDAPLFDFQIKKDRPDTIKAGQSDYDQAVTAYQSAQYVTAMRFAKTAANAGHADAQFMQGHMLQHGTAGTKDLDETKRLFETSALNGNTDAMMALGEMSILAQAGLKPEDALSWFSMAANANRGDAMRAIGEMYLKGTEISKDLEKGREWLRKAIDFGDDIAIRLMADNYFETDANTAMRWYKKAAAQGDYDAAYVAAIMYEENFDIKPDTAEMARLMRLAAKAGHAAAQADYGLLVYQGRGVEASIDEAADWFEKSARNGDKEGQFLYAFTLAKGEGVEQSYEDAYYWLLKSGESGISAYDKDRQNLKKRLEENVDPSILQKARNRFANEQTL